MVCKKSLFSQFLLVGNNLTVITNVERVEVRILCYNYFSRPHLVANVITDQLFALISHVKYCMCFDL